MNIDPNKLKTYTVYIQNRIKNEFYGTLATFGSHRIHSIIDPGVIIKLIVDLSEIEISILAIKFPKKDFLFIRPAEDNLEAHKGYAVDKDSL